MYLLIWMCIAIYQLMVVFCDRLKLGPRAALDCQTGQNKGRYCEKKLSFLLVSLIRTIWLNYSSVDGKVAIQVFPPLRFDRSSNSIKAIIPSPTKLPLLLSSQRLPLLLHNGTKVYLKSHWHCFFLLVAQCPNLALFYLPNIFLKHLFWFQSLIK